MFLLCFHISVASFSTQNEIPCLNVAYKIFLALATFLIWCFPTLVRSPSHTCLLSFPQEFCAFPSQGPCNSFLCWKCVYLDPWMIFSLFFQAFALISFSQWGLPGIPCMKQHTPCNWTHPIIFILITVFLHYQYELPTAKILHIFSSTCFRSPSLSTDSAGCDRQGLLFGSLLYSQYLEQCQAHGRHPVDTYWINFTLFLNS